MTGKTRNIKHSEKLKSNNFFKKTLLQTIVSVIIFLIMLVSVQIGGKDADFNMFVRRFLFENTDIKQTTIGVFNKVNQIIDDEIKPVINNIGVEND